MVAINFKKLDKRKKIFIGVGILLLIAFIKLVFFPNTFLYAGTIDATKVDLSSQLSSSISEVHVQEGDHVESGQTLLTLSCEDYKAEQQLANDEYERNYRMYQKGAVSAETFDQVFKRKRDADIHIKWCSIESPIQGTVLSRFHEPGEVVSPGVKLLSLANIKEAWAYIYVPQPMIAKLKVGMKLKGILPELNNREFEGHIIKINSEAEFTPKNVQTRAERTRLVFGVKVSFIGANDEEILKPGMTIEIKLPEK